MMIPICAIFFARLGAKNISDLPEAKMNWDEIYSNLQQLEELRNFAEAVSLWVRQRQ